MARTKWATGSRKRGRRSRVNQTRHEDEDDDPNKTWVIHSIEALRVRLGARDTIYYEFFVAWAGWGPKDNTWVDHSAFTDKFFVDDWVKGVNWEGKNREDPKAFKDKEKFYQYNPASDKKVDRRPSPSLRIHPLNDEDNPFCIDFSDDNDDELPSPSTLFGINNNKRIAPSQGLSQDDQSIASTSHSENYGPPAKRRRTNDAHPSATSTRANARLTSGNSENGTRRSACASQIPNHPSGGSFEVEVVSPQLRPSPRATSIGSTGAHTHPHTTDNEGEDANVEHDEEEIDNGIQEVFVPDAWPTPEFTQAGEDEYDSVMATSEPDPIVESARSYPLPEFTRASPPVHEPIEPETFMRELQSPPCERETPEPIDETEITEAPAPERQSPEPPPAIRKPSIKTDPSPYSTPPPRTPGPAHNTPASTVQFSTTPFGDSVVVSMNGNVPHRVLFASSGHKSKALAKARRSLVIASPVPARAAIVPAPELHMPTEPEPELELESVSARRVEENGQDMPTSTPTATPTPPVGVRPPLPLQRKRTKSTDPLLSEALQAAVRKGPGKPRLSATESAYFSNKPKAPPRLREGI